MKEYLRVRYISLWQSFDFHPHCGHRIESKWYVNKTDTVAKAARIKIIRAALVTEVDCLVYHVL
ncbi:MAG: hypothetical protein FWE27_02235 [Defluviitaleaceae bacterium]|nr:hypothetical protein [Defluviitaleaceae bacterium]